MALTFRSRDEITHFFARETPSFSVGGAGMSQEQVCFNGRFCIWWKFADYVIAHLVFSTHIFEILDVVYEQNVIW